MEKKSKKRKHERMEDENGEIECKKSKHFNGADFRKELTKENLVSSLKNLLKVAEEFKDEPVALEYLEAGGSVQELLLLMDVTSKTDLTTALPVFRVLHLIFLSVKGPESNYYAEAKDGARFLLDSFIPTIQAMMNINSNKHRKAVLKVLTSMVTLFPSIAREIMDLLPTVPSVITQFLRPQPGTDSVRKWFIFFILSFIVGEDFSLIRALMNMKGLLGEIVKDLKFDEANTVNVFLSVLREKVLENVKITKTLKLKVFNTQVVAALFDLYNWKSPKNINTSATKGAKEKDVNQEDKELVAESAHAFLLVLCTSKKFGIVFTDNNFGSSGEYKNNLLITVIQSLSEPWESKKMSELLVEMVIRSPDLMKVTLSIMENALPPRESKKWNNLLRFAENLLESIDAKDILKTTSELSDVDIVQVAKQFCTPTVVIRNLSQGIHNRTCFPILYYSMKVLTIMWRNTEEVLAAFVNPKLKATLPVSFNNCLLDVDEILTVWDSVCTSFTMFDTVNKPKFLNVILDFLEMNSKCGKDAVDSPSLIASKMLQTLEEIKNSLDDTEYVCIQSRIFYLVTSVDPMSVTPDNHLFRKAVSLLLMNKSKPTVESLAKILLSTGVFENNESEVDIWLACFYDRFQEFQQYIPNLFADCVSRLYLKEVDLGPTFVKTSSKKKSIFNELMEIETSALAETMWKSSLTESPTPMLIQFLKIFKGLKKEDDEKLVADCHAYVNDVAFRLFHYYNNSQALLKYCQENKKQIAGSVLTYMEGNKRDFLKDNVVFLTEAERQILPWLFKRKKHKPNFEVVLRLDESSNLALFLTFNSITSCLVTLVSEETLTEECVAKFSEFFSFFMRLVYKREVISSDNQSILSYDIVNLTLLRIKCIRCLFSIPLTEKFDIYESKNETVINFTKIMASAIMGTEKVDVCNLDAFQPWKTRLLGIIRSNLKNKNKTSEMFGTVEPVLDRIHFTSGEISDILNEYCNVADIDTFINEGQLTLSTMVFTKFVRIQCENSEPNRQILKQLWKIRQQAIQQEIVNCDLLDECFVYILNKRPKSLLLIDDDFLEGILNRPDFSEHTSSLGRFLLSDPKKVEQFVELSKNNFKESKNKKIIVAMMSHLIRKDDGLSELLRFKNFCSYWKESELLVEERETEILQLLKVIHKKYKNYMFQRDLNKAEFVLQYADFFSLLAKLFLGKEMLVKCSDTLCDGSFWPEILHETIIKHADEDIVLNYATGLLNICSQKLREAENGKCEESEWFKYSHYIEDLIKVDGNFKWNKLSGSSTWKDFCRLSLRICFNFPTCPSFLRTFRNFVELLYRPGENSEDVGKIFDMVISHSQFLSIILQNSPLKGELVKFYCSLIRRNDNVLRSKHIPVLLASYSGGLSENDVTLLNILRFYEGKNVNMNEYEPFVWGESAVSHYSVKTGVGVSLWRRINMLNVLELLDPKRIEISLKEFPVTRNLKTDEMVPHNDRVYDPAFLLPIFANLLSPGAVTYCLPFIQKGCFAYTVCSLSSQCKEIRMSGCVVLARLYNHLELVQNMKLKTVWLHFINCLRYGIEDIGANPLPSVVTYFLAKASLEFAGEPGDMFMSLQKFLLAKPVFNYECIPEFLPLFHSSDVHYMKHRRWILEVLRDGFKQNTDVSLLFQTMGVKIILSYFRSQFCTRELKFLVLEMVTNILKTDKSKLLLSEYGLLTWLNSVCLNCDKELFHPFIRLTSSATTTVKTKLIRNVIGKRNLFYPIQILNILMKALPNLSESRSNEAIETFLKIVLECLMILLKFKHGNWCKLNRKKLDSLSEIIMKVTGDESLREKYSKSKIFYVFRNGSGELERLYQAIVFLWDVLLGIKLKNQQKK